MKISDIDLNLKEFDEVRKRIGEYFGPHFPNVIEDFNKTNKAYLKTNGDPVLKPEQKNDVFQALKNYFIFYCFGVANTIDPKSNFNTEYKAVKTNELFQKIESGIKEGIYDK